MLIDITLKITPKMVSDAQGNEKKAFVGHLGTHFDVMDKDFPLEYTERKGITFDVSTVRDREIDISDINPDLLYPDMFAAFYTGFIEEEGYGGKKYFTEHPQLSNKLIDLLLEKKVSVIGVDCAGVRQGAEHSKTDQRCADRGVFVVENLCNLKELVNLINYTVNTYPMNYEGMTGLPCRVIVKTDS